jgi:allantoinase
MESKNFPTAWGGLSGLQYQLQATWTDAIRRNCTSSDMAKWWSENPARLAGLETYKGKIHVGYQADLCWWDPDHVGAPNDYCREYHRWKGTTYFADNVEMVGRVLGTWVKGELVYDGLPDQHYASPGRLLTRRD